MASPLRPQGDPRAEMVKRAQQLWDQYIQKPEYSSMDDAELKQIIIDQVKSEFAPAEGPDGPMSLREVQARSPEQQARINRIKLNQARDMQAEAAPPVGGGYGQLESLAKGLGRGVMAIPNAVSHWTGIGNFDETNAGLEDETGNLAGALGETAGEAAPGFLVQGGLAGAAGKLLPRMWGAERLARLVARIPGGGALPSALRAGLREIPEQVAGGIAAQGLISGPRSIGANRETATNLGYAGLGSLLAAAKAGSAVRAGRGPLERGMGQQIQTELPPSAADMMSPQELNAPSFLRNEGGMGLEAVRAAITDGGAPSVRGPAPPPEPLPYGFARQGAPMRPEALDLIRGIEPDNPNMPAVGRALSERTFLPGTSRPSDILTGQADALSAALGEPVPPVGTAARRPSAGAPELNMPALRDFGIEQIVDLGGPAEMAPTPARTAETMARMSAQMRGKTVGSEASGRGAAEPASGVSPEPSPRDFTGQPKRKLVTSTKTQAPAFEIVDAKGTVVGDAPSNKVALVRLEKLKREKPGSYYIRPAGGGPAAGGPF